MGPIARVGDHVIGTYHKKMPIPSHALSVYVQVVTYNIDFSGEYINHNHIDKFLSSSMLTIYSRLLKPD